MIKKLELTSDGPVGNNTKLILDGFDLPFIEFKLEGKLDKMFVATIKIYVKKVEINTPAKIILKKMVRK